MAKDKSFTERVIVSCEYKVKYKKLNDVIFEVNCRESNKIKKFKNKNPEISYKNMIKFIKKNNPKIILESSSMNHLVMDQSEYIYNDDGFLVKA